MVQLAFERVNTAALSVLIEPITLKFVAEQIANGQGGGQKRKRKPKGPSFKSDAIKWNEERKSAYVLYPDKDGRIRRKYSKPTTLHDDHLVEVEEVLTAFLQDYGGAAVAHDDADADAEADNDKADNSADHGDADLADQAGQSADGYEGHVSSNEANNKSE